MKYFNIVFLLINSVFQIWCVFSIYSTAWAHFQVLTSLPWPVATVLNSAGLEDKWGH